MKVHESNFLKFGFGEGWLVYFILKIINIALTIGDTKTRDLLLPVAAGPGRIFFPVFESSVSSTFFDEISPEFPSSDFVDDLSPNIF